MKKTWILHPFLFGLFPVLTLFSHNINKIPMNQIKEVLGPAAGILAATSIIFLLLYGILRNAFKAGLITSIFLLFFFSYWHFEFAMNMLFFSWLEGQAVEDQSFHSILKTIQLIFKAVSPFAWCLIFIISSYFITRTKKELANFTKLLNVVSIFLVLMPIFNTGMYLVRTRFAWQGNVGLEYGSIIKGNDSKINYLPDIYYIILDGYARADVLNSVYGYDNSDFLQNLSGKGFFVAARSRSNYSYTCVSLASSLNSSYLDRFVRQIGEDSKDDFLTHEWIQSRSLNSNVLNFLTRHGYKLVAFSSGYSCSEMESADLLLYPPFEISEFQQLFISMTPIEALMEKMPYKSLFDLRRERILFIFDKLTEIPEIEAPTFTFTHVIAPHPPFVLGENGEHIEWPEGTFYCADGSMLIKTEEMRMEYQEGYVGQVKYINGRILHIVSELLNKSKEPPIIVIQADHGGGSMVDFYSLENTNLKERMSILNAYYLPGIPADQLYDEISPVNTFRVIFNQYFGTNLDLLEDRSYFSILSRPYKFVDVTDSVK